MVSKTLSPRPSRLVDDVTVVESIQDSDDCSITSGSASGDDSNNQNNNSTTRSDRFRFRVRGIKQVIKTLMARHGGSTRHPRVTKMIQKLKTMNPTQQPAKSNLLLGDFIAHSSPDFPGRIRHNNKGGISGKEEGDDDHLVQYTLGRLSFGIFQPHNLVCTVRSVRNSIQICEDSMLCEECAGPHYVVSKDIWMFCT